jgi:hypothetical protein
MTNHARPSVQDHLRHARQFYELTILLNYDGNFAGKFSTAVEAGDDAELGSLLAPLGMERVSISPGTTDSSHEGTYDPCEHCWEHEGKTICVPICM